MLFIKKEVKTVYFKIYDYYFARYYAVLSLDKYIKLKFISVLDFFENIVFRNLAKYKYFLTTT